MATFSLGQALLFVSLLLLGLLGPLVQPVSALQVTPGSPCSSFCIDESNLDETDPESSNTTPKDISCPDEDYASQERGQKFQRCLTCLQDSDYAEGHESDQQWFLYNLRYAVDYCILGYPNATDVETSPCMTSEACGRLEGPLKDGLLDPAYAEPYDFCDADGGNLADEASVRPCVECVSAGSSHVFLSNFLVALQAGCQQQPANGIIIGLNDTVFSTNAVEIVDPHSATSDADASGGSKGLQPSIIAAIAVGAFAAVVLAGGCVYMQIRRRRNQARRAARNSSSSAGGAPMASPLSFRCQTHVTPRSPEFPPAVRGGTSTSTSPIEKPFAHPSIALGSNPIGAKVFAIDTLAGSAFMPSPAGPAHSPDDYFTTPTSTVSTRSNAPLLSGQHRPYYPASYASPNLSMQSGTMPGLAMSSNEPISAVSAAPSDHSGFSRGRQGRLSPYMEQRGFQQQAPAQAQAYSSPWDQADTVGGETKASRDIVRKKGALGEPVQVTRIQTSFPPPPKR